VSRRTRVAAPPPANPEDKPAAEPAGNPGADNPAAETA
jgi:hypothetical protein